MPSPLAAETPALALIVTLPDPRTLPRMPTLSAATSPLVVIVATPSVDWVWIPMPLLVTVPPVVTFTVDGYEPSLVSQVLADEHAIAVRDGRFCAHLLCDAIAGDDATAIRASLGLATTGEHVDRLVSAVRRLVEHGPALSYVHTGDGWSAPADPRDLAEPLPW